MKRSVLRKQKKKAKNSTELIYLFSFMLVGIIFYMTKTSYPENTIIPYILLIGIIILLSVLVIIFCINYWAKNKKKSAYLSYGMREIDQMSGEDFEELLLSHFEQKGYKVSLTPLSNDYGADLVLYKNNKKLIVQAKRYKSKVGNSAIQEIVAAKPYYKADGCMVVTNSFLTANAIKLADANNVIVWDRNKLKNEFHIK